MIPEVLLYCTISYIILSTHFQINLMGLALDIFYLLATTKRRVQCFSCGMNRTVKLPELKKKQNIWNCSSCSTENQVVGSFWKSIPSRHDCKNELYCLVCTANKQKNLDMIRSRNQKICNGWHDNVFCRECLHNQQIVISALSYDSPPVWCLYSYHQTD